MAYAFERGDSPFWWIGFNDESGKPDKEPALRPDGSKIRVDGKTPEEVRATPDLPGKPRDMKQARKDAERAADDRERLCQARREGRVDPELITGYTFAMLAKKYLEERVAGTRSKGPTTSRIKHLVRYFGPRMLVSILSTEIKPYLNMMLRTPTPKEEGISRSGRLLSASSVEHLRRDLRAMFNFAIEARLMRVNPVLPNSEVDVPEVEIRLIDAEQVVLLLRHADQIWRAFIAVGLYCGLRKGEVIGLRVKDVDLRNGLIEVAHSYNGPTKGKKTRVVPIPPELVPYLKLELGRVRSEYLFPNSKGKMWSKHKKTEEIIRRAAIAAGLIDGFDHLCRRNVNGKACGFVERRADQAESRCPNCNMILWVRPVCIDIQFKDTRSTYATAAYEATGDERYVVDTLGHEDPRVTQRYRKSKIEHLSRQGAKLSYAGVPHDPLTIGAAGDASAAHVIRIDSGVRGVTALRDEGVEPTTFGSGDRSGGLEEFSPGFASGDFGQQSAALSADPRPHADRHPVAPDGTNWHPITHVPLTLAAGPVGEHLLTVADVAARLSLPISSVRGLIWRGELSAQKVGTTNSVRVRASDLAAFIALGGPRPRTP